MESNIQHKRLFPSQAYGQFINLIAKNNDNNKICEKNENSKKMVAKHAVFSIFTIKSFVLRDEMTFCRRCCSIIMIICLNPLNVIDICYCQSVGKRHGFSSRHIAQVPTIEQCNTNISCMHGPNNFFSLTTILFFHVH